MTTNKTVFMCAELKNKLQCALELKSDWIILELFKNTPIV